MTKERFKCPISVHIFLKKDNKILFQLRKNCSFSNMYGVVAGHLDGNETVVQAAIREAREEIGVDISPENIKFATLCHSNVGNKEYLQFFMWCNQWKEKITNLEPEKCSELVFLSIDKLPDNLVPYISKALNMALDNVPFYEDGWE